MFESVNSVSLYNMVRQTVPDGYYPVSEIFSSHSDSDAEPIYIYYL